MGLLIQCGEKGSEDVLLSQAAPFFANSDPDMPAVPVPAAHIHDWLLQNIIASLEHTAEKFPAKDSGPPSTIDADATMVDASSVQAKNLNKAQALFVEGISKSFLFKQASDTNGNSVKVIFKFPHLTQASVISVFNLLSILYQIFFFLFVALKKGTIFFNISLVVTCLKLIVQFPCIMDFESRIFVKTTPNILWFPCC